MMKRGDSKTDSIGAIDIPNNDYCNIKNNLRVNEDHSSIHVGVGEMECGEIAMKKSLFGRLWESYQPTVSGIGHACVSKMEYLGEYICDTVGITRPKYEWEVGEYFTNQQAMFLAQLLSACEFKLPNGVSQGQSFLIQAVATYLPNTQNKISISGYFVITDPCTITIKDLIYTPQMQQVFLYSSSASNINDSSASGQQLSTKEIAQSAFKGTLQNISLTKSIEDAKSLKLFSSQSNFVLGASTISNNSNGLSPTFYASIMFLIKEFMNK